MPKAAITRVSNLEIAPSSTNKEKGFYTAPITTAQRDAMTQDDGGFIYNTDTKTFQGLQNKVWNNTYTQSSLGFSLPYTSKAANYTVAATDVIIGVDAIGGARTITLPPIVNTTAGQILIIKDESGPNGANAVTITKNADNATIDGVGNIALTAGKSGVVSLYSTGTAWFTIEKRTS